MTVYRSLLDETLPCWSKLLWTPSPAAISLFVHEDVMHEVDVLTPIDPRIQHFLRYGSFVSESEKWGFDGSLIRSKKSNDGFTEFRAILPQVKHYKPEPCSICNGTGSEEDLDMKCLRCHGSGHPIEYNWEAAQALSASLSLLTDRINQFPPEQNTTSRETQLLTAVMFTMNQAYPLSGSCSRILVDWLNMKEGELEEPTQAVRIAWKTMMGELDDYDIHYLSAYVRETGRINVRCPGDACEIFPDSFNVGRSTGYELTCHNMDSSMQQLTLLAGLAAIEVQARKELRL